MPPEVLKRIISFTSVRVQCQFLITGKGLKSLGQVRQAAVELETEQNRQDFIRDWEIEEEREEVEYQQWLEEAEIQL